MKVRGFFREIFVFFFLVGYFEYALNWVLLIWLFLGMVYSYGFLVIIVSKILNSISGDNGLVRRYENQAM